MILLLIILFFVFNFILINQKFNSPKKTDKCNLKITIIVAAKNEEKNLPDLIKSLSHLNFNKEDYEVIIVDDNSTDKTYSLAKLLIQDENNFRVIKSEKNEYIAKRAALQTGIHYSKYDYIVITDADCIPEKNFLIAYCHSFKDVNEFIFGVSPYKQTKSFSNKISSFDNLRVHILTFGFADLGLPYSCAARSMGFSLSAFNRIGGFKNASQTLSGDDDLLLNEAVKNRLKIFTIKDPSAFVYTNSKSTLKDFIYQKSRHTSTSNYYPTRIKVLLGLWHGLNFIMLFSLFLVWFNINFLILPIIKIIIDIISVKYLMKKFGYSFSIMEIIYLQLIYEVLLIINYIKGSFGASKW